MTRRSVANDDSSLRPRTPKLFYDLNTLRPHGLCSLGKLEQSGTVCDKVSRLSGSYNLQSYYQEAAARFITTRGGPTGIQTASPVILQAIFTIVAIIFAIIQPFIYPIYKFVRNKIFLKDISSLELAKEISADIELPEILMRPTENLEPSRSLRASHSLNNTASARMTSTTRRGSALSRCNDEMCYAMIGMELMVIVSVKPMAGPGKGCSGQHIRNGKEAIDDRRLPLDHVSHPFFVLL